THRKVSYPNKDPWPRLLELKYEKDTTGFFVSGHPLDDFSEELNKYTVGNISKLLSESRARECLIGAQVGALREFITKRGDRMAFATLEDQSGQIETVIFSDVYL